MIIGGMTSEGVLTIEFSVPMEVPPDINSIRYGTFKTQKGKELNLL